MPICLDMMKRGIESVLKFDIDNFFAFPAFFAGFFVFYVEVYKMRFYNFFKEHDGHA